jgi:uncharacterized membrane protein YeiB
MLFIGFLLGMMLTMLVYGMYIIVGAFILWMAVDAGKQDRFWWVVLILGIPVIGAFVYYFTEKKHEYARAPVHHVHESETEEQHEHAPHTHHESHGHLAHKE